MKNNTKFWTNVLFIEDDEITRIAVKESFINYEIDVTCAGSISEAINLLRAGPYQFNVILLDLGFPVGSAEEILNAIKNLKLDLPIVVCSGACDIETKAELLGAKAVIKKPYKIESLVDAAVKASQGKLSRSPAV